MSWLLRHPLVGGAIVVLVLAALPFGIAPYELGLVTQTLILAIFAMSVNLLLGFGGLVSLGHAGILTVAGFGVGYVSTQSGSFVLQILTAVGATLLVGAVYGLLTMRVGGVYFIMITLALGMSVWGLAQQFTKITGGDNGLRGIDPPPFMDSPAYLYWSCLVATVVAYLAVRRLVRSPFGLGLLAMRDSEDRLKMLGYNVPLHKFMAVMFSAGLAGLSGVLYTYYNQFISFAAADFSQSGRVIIVALIGGVGTLAGPLVGAPVVVLFENELSQVTDRWRTVQGIVFVLVVLVARRGIAGNARSLALRWRHRRRPDSDSAASVSRADLHEGSEP